MHVSQCPGIGSSRQAPRNSTFFHAHVLCSHMSYFRISVSSLRVWHMSVHPWLTHGECSDTNTHSYSVTQFRSCLLLEASPDLTGSGWVRHLLAPTALCGHCQLTREEWGLLVPLYVPSAPSRRPCKAAAQSMAAGVVPQGRKKEVDISG